jgi:DNA (cytosine-5)-methyltransferase 1
MKHASLFSGIGGFDLAAEWAGWENIFHCEWNSFGQKVLKHHFPNSISYNDITKTDFSIHSGQIDVLTGGFPCQPYSQAGKRLGKADERHLFPEMLRCIKEVKPRWIIGENVRGLVSWNEGLVFNEVYDDLEREGYEVQSFLIPAASVNAQHQRQRIWFVARQNNAANPFGFRLEGEKTNGNLAGQKRFREYNIKALYTGQGGTIESPICGENDGLPRTLDRITFPKWRIESVKAYGNAIVPQVAYQIFQAINEFEIQNM